jgi:Fe-S cluster biogenesis protein NfuA
VTSASSSEPAEEDLQEALAYIRPLLKGHSGDLTIASVDDGVVTVDFHNACHSCPAISVTFAGLVRSRLLQVDGVKDVRSGQVHASRRALDRIAATLGSSSRYRPSLPLRAKQAAECQPLATSDSGRR